MSPATALVVCGLSGQGVILVSRILASALGEEGRAYRLTEVPGIKHRYTLTQSFVRVGEDAISPRVGEAEADLLVGFEPFETVRAALRFCRPGASVVYNSRVIDTRHITSRTRDTITFRMPEPEDVRRYLAPIGVDDIRPVDATGLAMSELGEPRTQNVILVGAAFATGKLPLQRATLERVIERLAPGKTGPLNLAAFRLGLEAAARRVAPTPA